MIFIDVSLSSRANLVSFRSKFLELFNELLNSTNPRIKNVINHGTVEFDSRRFLKFSIKFEIKKTNEKNKNLNSK